MRLDLSETHDVLAVSPNVLGVPCSTMKLLILGSYIFQLLFDLTHKAGVYLLTLIEHIFGSQQLLVGKINPAGIEQLVFSENVYFISRHLNLASVVLIPSFKEISHLL